MFTITVKQMAAIKRTAANVLPETNKKAKLAAKIVALSEELEQTQARIDVQQGYVKSIANGLTTEDLVVRREQTFAPNPALVSFDEEKRVYVVYEEGDERPATPAVEEANNPHLPESGMPEASQEEVAAGMAEAAAEAEAHEQAQQLADGGVWGGEAE